MPRAHKTGKLKIRTAERRAKALALRKAGATLDQIGQELGVTRQAVHKMLSIVLEKAAEEERESAKALRELQNQQLDEMQLGIWKEVRKGDEKKLDRMLRIMERRAKLNALDSPLEIDVSVKGEREVVLGAIAEALENFPEAREAVANALRGAQSE